MIMQMLLPLMFAVCSTAYTDKSGDAVYINPMVDCEIVRTDEKLSQLASRVDELKHSAYRVTVEVYRLEKVSFETSIDTKSVQVNVPSIKLLP